MQNKQSQIHYKITSINIVCNKALEAAFEAKRREFASKGIPFKEVLAFHGTPATNIDSIIKTNLQYTVNISPIFIKIKMFHINI